MADVKMDALPASAGLGHPYTRHNLLRQNPAAPYSPPPPMARPKSTTRAESQPSPTPKQVTQAGSESESHTKVPFSTPASLSTTVAPVPSQPRLSNESHNARSHQPFLSPPAVSLDAVQRLQTQISQNSGALAAHTRDIRRAEESCTLLEETLRREFNTLLTYQSGEIQRVDGAVARLHHEMLAMRQSIDNIRHELHMTKVEGRQSQQHPVAPPPQPSRGNDSALELLAQQMALTAQKANEIDVLKITVEIMKKKIYRLEEGSHQLPAAGLIASSTVPQTVPSTQSSTIPHAAPPAQSFTAPHAVPSAQQSPQLQLYHSSSIPTTTGLSDLVKNHDHTPSHPTTGWATVNSGVKRNHGTDQDSLDNEHAQAPSSTKRTKLASEPSQTLINPTPQSSPNAQVPQPQFLPQARPLPSQPPPSGSTVDTQSQSSSHVPFVMQNDHPVDSWHSLSQRDMEHRPRGRGRGGGPGSRGGKVRKTMPVHIQPLEWDREDWQGGPDYQNRPDTYVNQPMRSATGIARRGTGGGGGGTRHGYTPTDRPVSLNATPSVCYESPGEVYENGKKTRTKPVRNAEGILIRKDGRPDMRSQSSAANLRKIHAQKEGEGENSPSETPSQLHDGTATHVPATPSPHGRGTQDVTARTHSKHTAIMDKMFPRGVEESRKENDYTRELFDRDHDHTVHTRARDSRAHATSPPPPPPPPLLVKQEPGEQHALAEIQSPGAANANVHTNGGGTRVRGAAANGPVANEAQADPSSG